MLASVEAAVRPGMAGPVADVSSALALAQARGVAPDLAAELIGAAVEGFMQGCADRRGEGNGSS